MPRAASEDALDKFRRYRAKQRSKGLKLMRVWVPDPTAPMFRDEARRQAAALRGAPEEAEALEFLDAAATDLDDWTA